MADVQETQPTAGRPPVAPAQPPAPSGGGVVEREFTVQARSQARMVVRRFLAHKLAVVSLVILLLLIVTSFVGGHLWHYKYADITNEFSTGPTLKHPFGTDSIGHDSLTVPLSGFSSGSVSKSSQGGPASGHGSSRVRPPIVSRSGSKAACDRVVP